MEWNEVGPSINQVSAADAARGGRQPALMSEGYSQLKRNLWFLAIWGMGKECSIQDRLLLSENPYI